MKLLAFSDLHRDLDQAAKLVEMSADADVVIGAGDFASVHEGLEETIAALAAIETPTILVPGNNETVEALREATADWEAATVLHGEATTIDGVEFFGLGAGIPVTPWDWSFDLDDGAASAMLGACPEGAVLVLHSPPQGPLRQRRRRHPLRQPGAAGGDRGEAAAAGRLRPHPRGLGLREHDRRDAAAQPRPDRHLARDLGGRQPGRGSGRGRSAPGLVLATLIGVAGVANLNLSVANVALPDIGQAFDAGQTAVDLVAVGYSLGLAASVLYLGAVGDRYGRKPMLLLGMALSIPASILAAFAPSITVLFAARVLGGVAAGMAYPTTLALITALWSGHERTKAIALWSALGGGMSALGPLIAGALLEGFAWGSVFIVTAPLAAIALFFVWRLIPAHVNETTEPVDHLGGILSIALVGDAGAGDQPGAGTRQGDDRDRARHGRGGGGRRLRRSASAAPPPRSMTSIAARGAPSGSRRWPGSSSSAR